MTSSQRNLAASSLVATLCMLLAATTVNAWPGARGEGVNLSNLEQRLDEKFARLDADGNGEVDANEFVAANDRRHERKEKRKHGGRARHAELEQAIFQALDSNQDGQLSPAEFNHQALRAARHNAHKEQRFSHLDQDNSGTLSRDELSRRLEHLRAADQNGDGTVSRQELRAMRHQEAG